MSNKFWCWKGFKNNEINEKFYYYIFSTVLDVKPIFHIFPLLQCGNIVYIQLWLIFRTKKNLLYVISTFDIDVAVHSAHNATQRFLAYSWMVCLLAVNCSLIISVPSFFSEKLFLNLLLLTMHSKIIGKFSSNKEKV